MATTPQFSATILHGSAVLSATASTSYTAPSNSSTIVTAGATGSKIDEIRFQANGTTIQGTVTVFAFDGSTYWLIDAIYVPVGIANTVTAPWQYVKAYPNLVLLNGWSLRCASTVASQLICVSAFGGSL